MIYIHPFILILCLMLSSCGGSDDNNKEASSPIVSENNGTQQPPNDTQPAEITDNAPSSSITDNDAQLPVVDLLLVEGIAIEKTQQLGSFLIKRSGASQSMNVHFDLLLNTDAALASPSDYLLTYQDGKPVEKFIVFHENQSEQLIYVQPVIDRQHEVPERLTLALSATEHYQINDNAQVSVSIIDASNAQENDKVFLGQFTAHQQADTLAFGAVSLILSGDNNKATLHYKFENLSGKQTDQYISYLSTGTVIKDIRAFGNVKDFEWDLKPNGIFKSKQAMLDALFNGEFLLTILSANYANGEISAEFNYQEQYQPIADVPLTTEDVDRDIIRFLNQATFGATPESYQQLRKEIAPDGNNRIDVYRQWITTQLALPQTSLLALSDELQPHFTTERGAYIRSDAFWPMAVYGKDQLRQRLAFALSQILVVSDESGVLFNAHRGLAHYWDQLAKNSDISYYQALKDATYSPVMGVWLSHLRNNKFDEEKGTYPDENFAREIMQLFSFGLIHRHPNGQVILGEDSLPIPTYDNDVIKNMAKVFTGLAFSYYEVDGEKTANTRFTRGNQLAEHQFNWIEPMKAFSQHHDFSEKVLFTDNGSTLTISQQEESEQAVYDEINRVLRALVSHQSTAPVISRKLIQRFVTSNPSPDYIERVANAFGQNGNLTAVIHAILLDKEARNPNVVHANHFGKVKEPFLQMTNIMRLMKAYSRVPLGAGDNVLLLEGESSATIQANALNLSMAEQFSLDATLLRVGPLNIAQHPLKAPSVFNFFLPDNTPTGELASQSLVSPELQLLTESQIVNTLNTYHNFLRSGRLHYHTEEHSDLTEAHLTVWLSEQPLLAVWQATQGSEEDKAEAVLNFLDFYLNAGQLIQTDQQALRQLFIDTLVEEGEEGLLNHAVYGVASIPEFMMHR